MPDVLSELRSSLEKRLRELEPFITEHAQVRKALDALEGVGKRAEGVAASAAKRARTAKATAPARRRGRPRGSGGRAQEVLAHVHKQPGVTVAELAKRMKIKPNYLYRVLPQLEKDGKLHKRDKGYHPPAN
jgi:ribosomal protein S25